MKKRDGPAAEMSCVCVPLQCRDFQLCQQCSKFQSYLCVDSFLALLSLGHVLAQQRFCNVSYFFGRGNY